MLSLLLRLAHCGDDCSFDGREGGDAHVGHGEGDDDNDGDDDDDRVDGCGGDGDDDNDNHYDGDGGDDDNDNTQDAYHDCAMYDYYDNLLGQL